MTGGYSESFEVYSSSMNKIILNTAIIPDSYIASDKSYPVVYLLHGAGGSYASWIDAIPELVDLVDKYQLLLICPDGNKTSWYIDSPNQKSSKYATYINIELLDAVDNKFRALKGEAFRGITGFSMGGHGALYAAFKYPQQWDFAASISGGMDLEPFTKYWDLPKMLGEYQNNKDNWQNHSVVNLTVEPEDDPFKFLIYCGDQDFFLNVNNNLKDKLVEHKIAHEYKVLPGNHTWHFCRRVIDDQLAFFKECFNSKN